MTEDHIKVTRKVLSAATIKIVFLGILLFILSMSLYCFHTKMRISSEFSAKERPAAPTDSKRRRH